MNIYYYYFFEILNGYTFESALCDERVLHLAALGFVRIAGLDVGDAPVDGRVLRNDGRVRLLRENGRVVVHVVHVDNDLKQETIQLLNPLE